MLPTRQRLVKEQDFRYVLGRGKVVPGRFFLLKYAPSRDGAARVGFVVSKKVSPLATERNKVKRRAREITRAQRQAAHRPMWCAFIFKQQALRAPFSELARDMSAALKKIT